MTAAPVIEWQSPPAVSVDWDEQARAAFTHAVGAVPFVPGPPRELVTQGEIHLRHFTPEGLETLRRVLSRAICRNRGHSFVRDERGAPVALPLVCVRCGKWER